MLTMRNTFSVLFFQRKNANRMEEMQSVMARITINGKSAEINTGVKCYLGDWDTVHHSIIGRTHEIKEKNKTLAGIRTKINQLYYQQTLYGQITTANQIKETLTGVKNKHHYLLALMAMHNDNVKQQVGICKSKATYLKYEVTRKHLANFISQTFSKEDIALDKIGHQFICDFELYLRTVATCGANTTAKFIQFFKRIVILALNNNYITKNPFSQYQIRLQQVDREFLTMEELITIMQAKFTVRRLELIRDLFVFSCWTGLAYIDLKNLRRQHLYTIDGQLWIRINRQKSKKMSTIRLLDIPKLLLEKYDNPTLENLFPVPSNQKTNAYLKEIADICKIHKNITFHVARHTFATTIALSHGMPMESLAKMLGHSNIKTTQIYAKITDHKLNQDMENLEKVIYKM